MRSLSLALLALIILLSLCPAHHPTPARAQQPAPIGFFGMNTYITGLERQETDYDEGVATLVEMGRAAGVTWAREELSWANLEPAIKGTWNWQPYDTRIIQLAEAGYGIIGMLLTTPGWARKAECKDSYWCPPADPQDYADFVSAIVERYDGDGTDDAPGSPRVAAWQIWNEPNYTETWPASPAEYGALLLAGGQAAKAADPTATVVSGGVYVYDGGYGIKFLGAALDAVPEAATSIDVIAIHPYMPDSPPDRVDIPGLITIWGRIANTQSWMSQRGLALPLWITEVGWSTCDPDRAYCPPEIGKTEQQQANYLLRSHFIALALGVQHLSYFQLEDKFDGAVGNYWQEASILGEGRAYRQKPAYTAYAVMIHYLKGATFTGFGSANTFAYDPYIANPVATYHMRFIRPDGSLVDVLWRNSGTQQVRLPLEAGVSAHLVTWDGTSTPATDPATVTVGEEPVYLVQAAGGSEPAPPPATHTPTTPAPAPIDEISRVVPVEFVVTLLEGL
jgi:hypothetical protein